MVIAMKTFNRSIDLKMYFSGDQLTDDHRTAYLDRIGVTDAMVREGPSLEFLRRLQNLHMLAIPFEDLDIPGQRITLDLKSIAKKVIESNRGGFCYELNGLFHWLLSSLGYKVEMVSARVYNERNMQFGRDFDHLALLVHINKRYLVDVGFGDSFRMPLPLPDGEVHDVSGHYRISQQDAETFEVRKLTGAWIPQYRFTTLTRRFEDFREMCDFHQDDPSSHFRTRMLCSIATPTGRVTLSNNSLTITDSDRKNKIEVSSQEEFHLQLKKYFSIVLS